LIDITQQKEAELALRQLNINLGQSLTDRTAELEESIGQIKLLTEAVAHLGEGVLITTDHLDWPGPHILFVNEALCRITGYAADELIGQSPRILQGDDTDGETLDRIKAGLSAGRSVLVELTNYRKDGTRYDAELFITPLFDAEGHRTNFVSIHRDISERKRAERELSRLAAIVESSNDAIIGKTLDGTIESWNDAAERMYGYSRDEVVGKPITILAPPDRHDEIATILERVRRGEPVSHLETVRLGEGGQTIDVSLSVSPIKNRAGQVVGAAAIARDITEHKRAEEALRREHELSEGIINSAQHIILLLDTEGRIDRFNPYVEELTGWQLAEVQGRDWFETFLPECDREKIRGLFDRALRGKRTRGNVNPIVAKDGREVEIEWYDAPLTSKEGELIGLLCTGQDITERKLAEQALREREERLLAVLNTAADAIITIDQRGTIKSVNPATEKLFGYGQDELVGRNVKILMPPPFRDEHDGYIASFLKTGVARIIGVGREVVGRRKDGSTFPVGLAVSEVEKLNLFTGIIRDISAVKELQKEVLEIAAEEDRKIGHELHDNIQQQLTGLGLLAKSVAERLEAVRATEAMLFEEAGLLQTADTLTRVADGINETAKQVHLLSRGLIPVEVDAEGLRVSLTDLASRVGEQYGIQCEIQCAAAVGVSDNFVATHLYRIAQEAVTNAVKHGRAKRVEISLTNINDEITLRVLDNGIGIGDIRDAGPGMGLRIMEYRAGLIGATVQFGPAEDGGTQVSCTVSRGGGSLR